MTEQVKVPEGQAIVKEGEFGNDFFLILTGTAGVTQKGRPVNALGPGDFFGELAVLVRGTTRNATVTADSELDLLVIGRRESPAMFEIPRFREALLTKMASQLSTADARLANALDAKEGFEVA
jgi:CRP-like cAMP-binding protein